jgi:hypothetical protein
MKIPIKQIFPASVTSSVLDQNNFLITTFSKNFNLCSSVILEGQVSHPHATSGVIIVISTKGHPNITFFADKNKN